MKRLVNLALAALVIVAVPPLPASADVGGALAVLKPAAKLISAGEAHTCAILDGGAVKCWGWNGDGQLGLGDTADRGDNVGDTESLPTVQLGNGRTAVALSAGGQHTCALLDNASIKCWGFNGFGQLGAGIPATLGDGPGEMGDALPAVNLGTDRTAVAVAAGGLHTCAILDDGTVKCWGMSGSGQLGYGEIVNKGSLSIQMGDNLPTVALGTGRTAVAISAGESFTCVILDDGSVKCWGLNTNGQLGQGRSNSPIGTGANQMGDNLPVVDLGTGRTALAISAGAYHVCAILDDATLKCWGYNGVGQLGIGNTTDRGKTSDSMATLPTVNLGAGRTAVAVTAGWAQTCTVLDDRSVKCWGDNFYGELGLGNNLNRGDGPNEMADNLPAIDLGTGRKGAAVAGGLGHSCAVLDNGTVKCWGRNHHGQLGRDDTTDRGSGPDQMGNALGPISLGPRVGSVGIDLEVTSAGPITAGGQIQYDVSVHNTGTVTLTNVTLSSEKAPNCSTVFNTILGADTATFTCYLGAGDGDVGTLGAHFEAVADENVSDTADVDTQVLDRNELRVTLQASASSVVVGKKIVYTVALQNPGTSTMTGIDVTSTGVPACETTVASLAPGASTSYECDFTTTGADVPFKTNQVTALSDEGIEWTSDETSTAVAEVASKPDLQVRVGTKPFVGVGVFQKTKTTQVVTASQKKGGSTSYTVRVVNTGNTAARYPLRATVASSSKNPARFAAVYKVASTTITKSVTGATYRTPLVQPGSHVDVTVKVTRGKKAVKGDKLVVALAVGPSSAVVDSAQLVTKAT